MSKAKRPGEAAPYAGDPLREPLVFEGRSVDPATGCLTDEPGAAVNWEMAPVRAGTVIRHPGPERTLEMFFYDAVIPDRFVHTYDYEPESNGTTYRPELSGEVPEAGLVLESDGYVRLVLRSKEEGTAPAGAGTDSRAVSGSGTLADELRDLLRAVSLELPAERGPFEEEADRVSARVGEMSSPGDLTLLLLADSHYAFGGTWETTARDLAAVSKRVRPLAVIHLGDLTDGYTPLALTMQVVRRMLRDLRGLGVPHWLCIGNHDLNYFRGNTQVLDKKSACRLYLGREKADYSEDIPRAKVRLIFLDSFDPAAEERYGFEAGAIRFLKGALRTMPAGYRAVVFSHVPPLARLHVWSDTIRNGDEAIALCERFNRRSGGKFLAWIHGHNHADQVFEERSFPIVGIGCSKMESFKEKKPEGAFPPERERGTASEDLFDVLVIHRDSDSLDLIRYGAGEDRHIGSERA